MFSRAIDAIPPWTDRGMFDSIYASIFRESGSGSDATMIATTRALLSRRIGDGETFSVSLINMVPDSGASAQDSVDNAVISAEGENPDALRNRILIVQIRNKTADEVSGFIDELDKTFLTAHPRWEKAEKSDAFLNQHMKVRVLICKENNTAMLVTEKLSLTTWHLIQSALPTYVPALFKDLPLDPKEKAVLRALSTRSSSNYTRDISALEDFYDLRSKKIVALIGNFEKRERENQLSMIDNEIRRIHSNMEQLMSNYAQQMIALDNANIRRNGMVYTIDNTDDGTGLIEFFKANKALDIISVEGSRISFVVRATYENFDADAYETFAENERFFEETACRGVFSDAQTRKKFMDALFVDRRFKVRLCGVYHLDIRGSISTSAGYNFPPNCADYIPNYHLNHHRCLGGYEKMVVEYLQRGDTMGAISACIDSAKSINIHETSMTFQPFMKQVFESTKRCIEFPDGTVMTPAEALDWLNKQEVEE